MDEQLAAIYGTGNDESDIEKTAAAELLVKLAEEQGVDLDDFSDEEVNEMINELYSDNGGIEHTASQEKFAEADFLGRVMAHSMVQELGNIEKQAKTSYIGRITGASGVLVGQKALGKAKQMLSKATSNAERSKALDLINRAKHVRGEGAKRMAVRVGLPAAGLAAAGGAAASMGGKKKQSSALDMLAVERANQMLAEAGYVKEASADEVEIRALQILEANGYPVEWNG